MIAFLVLLDWKPQVPDVNSPSTVSTLVVRRICVPQPIAYAHVVRGQYLPQVAPQALELPQSPRVSHQMSPMVCRRRLLVVLVDNFPVISAAALAHAQAASRPGNIAVQVELAD